MSPFFLDTGYQFDSLEKCIDLANSGDSSAQYYIGATYCGYGFPIPETEVNFNIAKEWYMKAAEQGHKDAQYYLGRLYHWQIKEYEKAIFWFMKSAEQGHLEAMVYLAAAFQKNIKKQNIIANYRNSIFWYEKVLTIKNIDITKRDFEIEEKDIQLIENVILNLVDIYLNANDDEIRNVKKAIQILDNFAEKISNVYMYLIHLYLNYNDMRTYDIYKAIRMLEVKSNSNVIASYLLGELYSGKDLNHPEEIQDFKKAELLFKNCIKNYSIYAINSLFLLYKKQGKYVEAFQLLYESHEKISSLRKKKRKKEKLYDIGECDLKECEEVKTFDEYDENCIDYYIKLLIDISILYKEGLGTEVDMESAKKYLRKAEKIGSSQARILLKSF